MIIKASIRIIYNGFGRRVRLAKYDHFFYSTSPWPFYCLPLLYRPYDAAMPPPFQNTKDMIQATRIVVFCVIEKALSTGSYAVDVWAMGCVRHGNPSILKDECCKSASS